MKKNRWTILVVMSLTVLLLAGCSGKSSTTTTSSSGTGTATAVTASHEVAFEIDTERSTSADGGRYDKIIVGLSSDPRSLTPVQPTLNSRAYFYWEIYECLFDLDGDNYIPALAKSYTVIDDLHYQVELWDCIYDADGNHITADDVVFSFDWRKSTGEMDLMGIYDSVKKVDDYTVEFTWTTAPVAIAALEGPWCRTIIFSQKAYEENNFATMPVGTGPYRVTEFTSGSKLVLEANDNYWGAELLDFLTPAHQANVQTIEYDIISEAAQHVIALQTGTIDFSLSVPESSMSQFLPGGAYSNDYNAFRSASNMFFRLEPNCSPGSLLNDVNLRLAIFYALDNNAIAQAVSGLIPMTAMGSDWYSDYVEAWDEMETYVNTFDLAKSKEYLAKSGYNGETLVICGNNTEQIKNIMVFVQALLKNAGINVEIQANEPTINRELRNHQEGWDLAVVNIGGSSIIGAANAFLNNKRSNTGMTSSFVNDPQLQELYELCTTAAGHTDENMTRLYQYVLDNGYMYFIASNSSNTVASKEIAHIYYREGQYETMGGSTFYLE